jgi:hypothetical protein
MSTGLRNGALNAPQLVLVLCLGAWNFGEPYFREGGLVVWRWAGVLEHKSLSHKGIWIKLMRGGKGTSGESEACSHRK